MILDYNIDITNKAEITKMKKYPHIILSTAVLLLLSACSTATPVPGKKTPVKKTTTTLTPKQKAPLLGYLKQSQTPSSQYSSFYPLSAPMDALAARLFLIDHAVKSIDVQYYIYHDDETGSVISAHLIKAAQKGVKVRILLDDMDTANKDNKLALLQLHPNIELKLFNPNILRTSFRNLALLFDVNRLGKRMHNKVLTADGSAAIIGGRNIGDEYFANTNESLFLDYDILITGKVMKQINEGFDTYWNSEEAKPAEEILHITKKTSREALLSSIEKGLKVYEKSPLEYSIRHSRFSRGIQERKLKMIQAKDAKFYYDLPSKVSSDENDDSGHISRQISQDFQAVHRYITIISPYFIPSDAMTANMKELRDHDIEVTVITNSLSSTDVFAVYGGYKESIKPLVEMGVKLYEVKGDSFKKAIKKLKKHKFNAVSLHTKLMLIDDERLIVGSANIDPRSEKLNTEYLMTITSYDLTRSQAKALNTIIGLKYFYKLTWGTYPPDEDGDVWEGPIWKTLENGKVKSYYAPPKASWFKIFGADFISLLPVKGYL